MSTRPTSNEVATEIKKLDWDEPGKYRVEWKSAEYWNFDATYSITEIRFGEGGRPMVKIEGPKQGEYLIDSNPAGRPKVKHLRSDGYTSSDRLAELHVYEEKIEWRHRLFKFMPGVSSSSDEVAE